MPNLNREVIPAKLVSVLLSIYCCWFFISAPLSMTKANVVMLLINASSLLFICLCVALSSFRFRPLRSLNIIVLVYFSIFLAPLLSGFLNVELLVTDYPKTVLSRFFTLMTCFLTLIAVLLYIGSASKKALKDLLNLALLICFVFIFFAFWQLISFYTAVNFPFEVRNWMHGVPPSMIDMFPKRLTSIAEEPNFYSPLIIETFLLSSLIIQNKFRRYLAFSITFLILVLTFSSGAYVNAALLMSFFIVYTFFTGPNTVSTYFKKIIFLFICIIVLFWLSYELYFLIDMFIYKMENEASGGSSRSQFIQTVSTLWINSNGVNMFFGSGISSMSHLTDLGVEESKVLFRITNNFFLDLLLEGGILSLLFILVFFSLLILISLRKSGTCKYKRFCLFLTVHLFITSMYRSEYLSMHFIWVLCLIFLGYAISLKGDVENDVH